MLTKPVTYRERMDSSNPDPKYQGSSRISHAIVQLQRHSSKGKKAEESLAYLHKKLGKEIKRHGEDSEKAQKIRALIGIQLEGMGRWKEVLTARTDQLKSLRREKGPESPEFAIVMRLYALDLAIVGLLDEARQTMEISVEYFTRTLGAEHEQTEKARQDLLVIESKVANDD
jgi:hypothetical protein